jgi:hypothetical protein
VTEPLGSALLLVLSGGTTWLRAGILPPTNFVALADEVIE